MGATILSTPQLGAGETKETEENLTIRTRTPETTPRDQGRMGKVKTSNAIASEVKLDSHSRYRGYDDRVLKP